MSNIKFGADRMTGFDKPTVWSIMTPLAVETKSINLGQGFPNWETPKFVTEAINKQVTTRAHQYTRAFGAVPLVEAISRFYEPIFDRKINAMTEVCVSAGAVACLDSIFRGLVNPGEEVILLDPSYDCYRGQIQMAGGKSHSVPLKPRKLNSKQDIIDGLKGDRAKLMEQMAWDVDFEQIEKLLSEKTKAILICSVHNPTGKVFSQAEYEKLAKLLEKYPGCVVIDDGVYEAQVFEHYEPLKYPRFANLPGQWDRTISVYSAGKLFSATGLRTGWTIGPAHLTKFIQSAHQYSIFCMNEAIQVAIAESLDESMKNNYWADLKKQYVEHRDLLVNELVKSDLDINIWIPDGGFFLICDISRITVDEIYFTDEKSGEKLTKDFAYCIQLAKKRGVVAIPCSVFYGQETKHIGENLIRFAICKTKESLIEAGKRLSKQ